METKEISLLTRYPQCFEKPRVISFVGAGGKTTCLFALARNFRDAGEKVLVTSTTALYKPEKEPFDCLWVESEKTTSLEKKTPIKGITIGGERVTEEQKLKGFLPESLERILQQQAYDRLLIESDGSREKPIKACNKTEPVLLASTDLVVGVLGLRALGQRMTEATVHRSQIFAQRTATPIGQSITEESFARLIAHPQGLFQYSSTKAKRVLILNQADTQKLRQQAIEIATLLREKKETNRVDFMLATAFDPTRYQLIWSEKI